jgi:hypothetical protein
MDVLKDILFRFFLTLLCGGSMVSILIGVGMLLKPERIVSLNQYFSLWLSSNKVNEHIDRPRWIERYLYRHHRLVGGFLFAGAIVVLYIFLFSYNARRISATMTLGRRDLMDALIGLLLVCNVIAALVGIIVLARPSLLREIEKAANRWISIEGMMKLFNNMRYSADQYVIRYSKIAGVALVASGLYVLIVLAPFLWRSGSEL